MGQDVTTPMTTAAPPVLPPGLRCPACRGGALRLSGDRLLCAKCRVMVRLLRRRGDPLPAYEPSDREATNPLPGAWWLGLVRGADEIWRPVALSPSEGRCWDTLLTCPLEGDRMLWPTDPPRRAAREGEEATTP